MRKLLLSVALSILSLLAPAPLHAQFVGYFSPQSVSIKGLINNATFSCNGATTSVVVANLGQSAHQLTYTITSLQAGQSMILTISGSPDGTNFFLLSDVATTFGSGALAGFGYYTVVQANFTCSGGGTANVLINYAGTSASPGVTPGLSDLTAFRKLIFLSAPANATASSPPGSSFQPPYGNTAGVLVFQYNAAGPSGSTLQVSCVDQPSGTGSLINIGPAFPLTTGTSVQTFNVPPFPCPAVQVTYTSGGASATTFTVVYSFTKTGTSGTTFWLSGEVAGASLLDQAYYCPATFTLPALGAATTQIVGGLAGQKIRVCSVVMSNTNATATTVSLVEGTGANCAVGQTTLVPAITLSANTGSFPTFVYAPGATAAWKTTTSGDSLCFTGSAAGAVNITITHMQYTAP